MDVPGAKFCHRPFLPTNHLSQDSRSAFEGHVLIGGRTKSGGKAYPLRPRHIYFAGMRVAFDALTIWNAGGTADSFPSPYLWQLFCSFACSSKPPVSPPKTPCRFLIRTLAIDINFLNKPSCAYTLKYPLYLLLSSSNVIIVEIHNRVDV